MARVTALACLLFGLGAAEQSMAIEQAKYSVVSSEPPYEIRDYAASVVAIVDVQGSRSDAVNSGFRLLANYIFGNNQQKAKIAMTAPVTQLPRSSERESTATPNLTAQGGWVVRFLMPGSYTLQSLPPPGDARVRFEQSPGHRAAVIRFSGFWSDANLKSHEEQLLGWMRKQHMTPRSVPIYAYYDPPWVPWFMRTIEVLIDMAPSG